jgi:hypothetical protein
MHKPEHGMEDPETNVTNVNMSLIGKIAMAHLDSFHTIARLAALKQETEPYWARIMSKRIDRRGICQ